MHGHDLQVRVDIARDVFHIEGCLQLGDIGQRPGNFDLFDDVQVAVNVGNRVCVVKNRRATQGQPGSFDTVAKRLRTSGCHEAGQTGTETGHRCLRIR